MRGGLTARIVLACALLASLLGGMFAVLLVAVSELREAGLRADRSIQILAEAHRLERLALDLETGQRGFVITGDRAFLAPWLDAQREIPWSIAALEQLVAGDRGAELQLQSIEAGIENYLSAWSRPVVEAAERDLAEARALVATGGGNGEWTASGSASTGSSSGSNVASEPSASEPTRRRPRPGASASPAAQPRSRW